MKRTIVAYIRMAATVIIAVVVRLCLDCVGLIMTQQDAAAAGFWPGAEKVSFRCSKRAQRPNGATIHEAKTCRRCLKEMDLG